MKCYAIDENPKSYIKSDICPTCAHNKKIHEPIIYKLVYYLDLQDALSGFGQSLGRHELKNAEWIYLKILKQEKDRGKPNG